MLVHYIQGDASLHIQATAALGSVKAGPDLRKKMKALVSQVFSTGLVTMMVGTFGLYRLSIVRICQLTFQVTLNSTICVLFQISLLVFAQYLSALRIY